MTGRFVAPATGAGAELDIRLAVGVSAAWLAVALCLGRSPATVLAAALIALVCGAAAVLAARWASLALVGFCVALVLLPLAGRLAHSRDSPLAQLAARRTAVTADLTVTADPRPLAAKGVAGSPRIAVRANARSIVVAGRRFGTDGPLLVLGPAATWDGVLPGQRVRVDGVLQPSLDRTATAVTLMVRSSPTRIGGPPWWQRLAGRARGSLREASSGLPVQERGLLPGLVDGDTAGLDPVLTEHFRLAGLTHLVAVSGTNCSILVGCVLLVLRRAGARPAWCAAIGGAALLMFVVVARPSPSVLRAAVMGAIALAALAVGRPRQAVPVLSGAVLALLLWNPLLATDPGFVMSVLATAALLVLGPPWAEALRRRRVPALLAESVAVAAAAHVVTAPVIAAIAGRVSLVAVPANVLAEVAVAPATVLGFAAAVVAPLWLDAGRFFAQLAGWPCRWLVTVADFFGALPGATIPWPPGLVGGLALLLVSVAVGVLALRTGPRRVLAAAALVAVIVQIPVRSATSGWPPPGWLFVACDVGQGDALVLRAGDHAAVEIDAGPEPVVVDRCLHDLGVTALPLVAFTHYHLDHVGGFAGVLRGRQVGRVVAGPLQDPESGVAIVARQLAARHLAVTTPAPGAAFDVGRVRLDVLGPPVAYHGTRSDPNNSSLVFRATIDHIRILLPGDAEIEAQQAMLASGVDLRADVLKVPHHGSAYSDPAFLTAVQAKLGVISVGLHNDYGHPSPLLLAELDRLGVPVRRTDHDGDVAVADRGGELVSVARGTRASAVAGSAAVGPHRPHRPAGGAELLTDLSPASARMSTCPPAPSVSMTCPPSCRRCCCSSATKNSSSAGRSARSPPPRADAIPSWWRPRCPAATSRAPNCTN